MTGQELKRFREKVDAIEKDIDRMISKSYEHQTFNETYFKTELKKYLKVYRDDLTDFFITKGNE
jgi:hypothetical protein